MRGHHELIEMRRNRKAPRMVFLNDYPCETDWFENPGDAVTICISIVTGKQIGRAHV